MISTEKEIERLKNKAREDLTDLLKEICKRCPRKNSECEGCIFKKKETFVRAFLS